MRTSIPIFSFIVPVYNTAKYLDEAIESLINQDFDLEKIEIILVNDASTDTSREKCLAWQEQYPEIITFIDKEQNEGVSAARNDGFAASHGRYINFFDSDDKWSADCCAEMNDFFQNHRNIRLAIAKYHLFESQRGPHPLYEHYTEDTVVDVNEEPSFIHASVNNCFISREVVHDFDISIQVSENFRFINELLLTLGTYGILSKPIYWYRRRIDGSSVVQRAITKRSFYTVTPYKVYDYLFKLSKARTGGVVPYLQHAIAHDIFLRLKRRPWAGLTENDLKAYKDILVSILKDIDDEILSDQVRDRTFKLYMLALKYDLTFTEAQDLLFMPKHSGFVMFKAPREDIEFCGMSADTRALLQSITHNEDMKTVTFTGYITALFPTSRIRIYALSDDGTAYEATVTAFSKESPDVSDQQSEGNQDSHLFHSNVQNKIASSTFDEYLHQKPMFVLNAPEETLRFFIEYDGAAVKKLAMESPQFGKKRLTTISWNTPANYEQP